MRVGWHGCSLARIKVASHAPFAKVASTMLVTFESSGGYAGLRLTSSVETDELPAAPMAEALQALETLTSTGPPTRTPQPRYHLTVHRPSGVQTIDVVEPNIPPALRPLLAELIRRARPSG
jgi:hypothetical protein